MTISDVRPDVQVRTRTHDDPPEAEILPYEGPESARAHAIPDDPEVRQDAQALEIVDHGPLPMRQPETSAPLGAHLVEAGVALADNYLASTPLLTVAEIWSQITGDPDEDRGRGLIKVGLVLCGVLRALTLTALFAVYLSLSTRRRVAGWLVALGVLIPVYLICRALLP